MNVVIIGAGEIGLYMAKILSKQNHNVIMIDQDKDKLEETAWQLDIAVKEGLGTDWNLLDNLLELKPDLLLALTNDDEVNLVCSSIAKHLGYPRTICRVKDNRFLNRTRLDFARLFNVDYFISPELLVAYDLYKCLLTLDSLFFETFAHGALQMRTIKLPITWNLQRESLSRLKLPAGLIVGLICRKDKDGNKRIIFPHGSDCLLQGDEITLIGEKEPIATAHSFFGIQQQSVRSVVIIGGSLIGVNFAKILQERKISVRLIEQDYGRCQELAKELPDCQILHHQGADFDFLLSEKVQRADFFISCTTNDESNVLAGLVAKEAGCQNVAIVLSSTQFIPLVARLGIIHVVAPRLAAANRILSLASSETVTSLVSLYDNEVEVLELTVSMNCKIIGVPLADLGRLLPRDFLIAMIQNRGRITIAKGDSVICPGDTVIIICKTQYVQELQKVF